MLVTQSLQNTTHKSPSHLSKWKKVWVVVSNDQLHEYTDWKKRLEQCFIFPLKLSSVKEAKQLERRFCFELVSPMYGRRVYQVYIYFIQKKKQNILSIGYW